MVRDKIGISVYIGIGTSINTKCIILVTKTQAHVCVP